MSNIFYVLSLFNLFLRGNSFLNKPLNRICCIVILTFHSVRLEQNWSPTPHQRMQKESSQVTPRSSVPVL